MSMQHPAWRENADMVFESAGGDFGAGPEGDHEGVHSASDNLREARDWSDYVRRSFGAPSIDGGQQPALQVRCHILP